MKKLFVLGAALALASSALAAPNVTQATQKGSALVWPDIRVDGNLRTLIRIQNDGTSPVDLKCYWMDGNKHRVDFVIPVTKEQPVWFDAASGNGTFQVNPFPLFPSNGFNLAVFPNGNPFLPGDAGPYRRGMLVCWAVDQGGQNQVKWNHLSGTATVYSVLAGAYEYNAYAFFVPTGIDLEPIGVAGAIELNGVQYDSCPLYQIGQFSPPVGLPAPGGLAVRANHLAITGCHIYLQQDWTPRWTKLQFDVWNESEVKFTGAYECADTWHETDFLPGTMPWDGEDEFGGQPFNDGLDSGAQAFAATTLGTYAARYRVQAVASTQCPQSQPTGVLAVQHSVVSPRPILGPERLVGTTLAAAGKFSGQIVWDPQGAVPEGGVR